MQSPFCGRDKRYAGYVRVNVVSDNGRMQVDIYAENKRDMKKLWKQYEEEATFISRVETTVKDGRKVYTQKFVYDALCK